MNWFTKKDNSWKGRIIWFSGSGRANQFTFNRTKIRTMNKTLSFDQFTLQIKIKWSNAPICTSILTNFARCVWSTISNSGKAEHNLSMVVVSLKPTLENQIENELLDVVFVYLRAISSTGPWPQINTCLEWNSVKQRMGVWAKTTCSGRT